MTTSLPRKFPRPSASLKRPCGTGGDFKFSSQRNHIYQLGWRRGQRQHGRHRHRLNPGSSISTIDFYDAGNQLTPPGNTATGYTNTTLANGSHALWVKVTDNYSQVGYSQTNTITIQGVASGDLAAPLVTISSSIASGSTVPTGTPINFQVTAANNGNGGSIANVQILVNDSSVATLSTSPYTYTGTLQVQKPSQLKRLLSPL